MIALYARSYWDHAIELGLDALAGGKGKLDVAPRRRAGGFACNAARTLAGRLEARIVTVAGPCEAARLRAALPAAVALTAIDPGGDPPLPVTVVLDPAGACRILRDPAEADAAAWRWAAVGAAVDAELHVLGRLPATFVDEVVAAARTRGARVAWCGGAAIAPTTLAAVDVACVNLREAAALVGGAGDAQTLARALAEAAQPDGAIRVVTGGAGPTAAAQRRGDVIELVTAAPAAAGPVVTLLGAGDAFAAGFLAAAAFVDGRPRAALAVEPGLAAGQAAAAAVVRGEVGDG